MLEASRSCKVTLVHQLYQKQMYILSYYLPIHIISNHLLVFYGGLFYLDISDITMETSALAYMMSSSREGRLKEVFHMFVFLKAKHNILMVFDPTKPDIDLTNVSGEDWSETTYGECNE